MKYHKTISGNLETLKQLHKLLGEAIEYETTYCQGDPYLVGVHTSENKTEILAVKVNLEQKDLIFSSKPESDPIDKFYQDLADSEW